MRELRSLSAATVPVLPAAEEAPSPHLSRKEQRCRGYRRGARAIAVSITAIRVRVRRHNDRTQRTELAFQRRCDRAKTSGPEDRCNPGIGLQPRTQVQVRQPRAHPVTIGDMVSQQLLQPRRGNAKPHIGQARGLLSQGGKAFRRPAPRLPASDQSCPGPRSAGFQGRDLQ